MYDFYISFTKILNKKNTQIETSKMEKTFSLIYTYVYLYICIYEYIEKADN